MEAKKIIQDGLAVCGIEFGSTRIKAVLTDTDGNVLATGGHDWENTYADGVWTYSLDEVRRGLASCYGSLRSEVERRYEVTPESFAAIGISGMMHGYLPFDAAGEQLARFQTWRNTNTQEAADILTEKFNFNIPLRWSIAHLYQRILDGEEHLPRIAKITTLAVYVHRLLTGEYVAGVGEASGMFPIDRKTCSYDESMLAAFDELVKDRAFPWKIRDILPEVRVAGEYAGTLTEEGAAPWMPPGI